ncbi:hypothetical protein ADUPG1_000569, partial [Aduncisulcus paluster]
PRQETPMLMELADGRNITAKESVQLTVRVRGALGKPLLYTGWFVIIPMMSSSQFPILLGKPFINETGWFSDGLKGLPEVILDVEEEELDVAQGGEQTGEFDLTSTAPELKLEIERLIRMYDSGESPRGICQAEPFRIELTNTTPVHTAPRHLSATRRKALEPLIDDLLDRGAIMPTVDSSTNSSTPAAEGGSETKVVAPTLKEYSLENLNDFFLRYEAYAADKTVKKPAHWFKLIDAPLRAALLDVTGTKKVSTDEEAKKFKKDLFSLDAPATSYDLHTELFTVVMEKSLSVTAFIKYVTNFKRIVSQAPDLGVDST